MTQVMIFRVQKTGFFRYLNAKILKTLNFQNFQEILKKFYSSCLYLGSYEYATIPYDDLMQRPHYIPRTPIRVSTPRLPPCYYTASTCSGPSLTYRMDPNHHCCHHNYAADLSGGSIRRCAPPNFKPPPPPPTYSLENVRSPELRTASTRPSSDDSAYGDEIRIETGQSSRQRENSGSSSGTLLLRMDLSKNPPVFCEGL